MTQINSHKEKFREQIKEIMLNDDPTKVDDELDDIIDKIYNDGLEDGSEEGYSQGYREGYDECENEQSRNDMWNM